jgi:fumarate hydratase subunit alpha
MQGEGGDHRVREIDVSTVRETVARLCIEANTWLGPDIRAALDRAVVEEDSPYGRAVLEELAQNADLARSTGLALCQDTGMAVVFLAIGQEVHFTGGSLAEAVDAGVADGYTRGLLRASVVSDPLLRGNTGDNTPAVLHVTVVPGSSVEVVVAPKGFGSENMSALRMLSPSEGVDGVKRVVLDTVEQAGPNPCPPVIVGVGLGGTMEKAALLAKRALLRPVGSHNSLPHIAALERELLEAVNRLGIGPAGLGGRTTALAVHVETYPTHIAGLPVAVNMGCHATRHAHAVL